MRYVEYKNNWSPWETVASTERPSLLDTTSSVTTVYQRRNIVATQIPETIVDDETGEDKIVMVDGFTYQERMIGVDAYRVWAAQTQNAQDIADVQAQVLELQYGIL